MKRIGEFRHNRGLNQNSLGDIHSEHHDILCEIREQLLPMLELQANCWRDGISPSLEREGILLLNWSDLKRQEQADLEAYFEKNLLPVLTPLAVDPAHPFPFISNLSTSFGVLLRNQISQELSSTDLRYEELFARVKMPSSFPGWLKLKKTSNLPQEERLISMREVVSRFIYKLFPGMDILETLPFRITRNVDIEREEEVASDVLDMISKEIRERRFANAVRLEHGACSNSTLRNFVQKQLHLTDLDTYMEQASVDFAKLEQIWKLDRKDLRYKTWKPVTPAYLSGTNTQNECSLFDAISKKDILVHHPYECFKQSVEQFIRAAVADPNVLAIKMALYRTGEDSPFIPLLVKAAEQGKQVVCLVEVKARFDEERNIRVAGMLEKAGVHVVYGIVGLKTHCKVALVVRQEQDVVRSYAHIGTGNYNPTTSELYTDLGLFTANSEITDDLVQLFNFLTGRSQNRDYAKLLVAPISMKQQFINLIRFEAEQAKQSKPARIVAKMNSLEDKDVIQELYQASQAGVKIDLIIRGFCCLRPGVPGLSENIRVKSILGRFLEHSRVYYFNHGATHPLEGKMFTGSADWMPRNLSWRVEAIVPILDADIKAHLWEILQLFMNDRRQSWSLCFDGKYVLEAPKSEGTTEGVHDRLMKMYESAVIVPTDL